MNKLILPFAFLLFVPYGLAFELNDLPRVAINTNKPYLSREAQITPEEYPLAQSIRPLLEQEDYQQATNILMSYAAAKSPALNLLYGQLLMQLEKWQDAEGAILLALETMPDLLRAHNALSSIYQILEKSEKARESITRAISLGAMEKNNFAMLAWLNMQLNDPHAAIAAYQQALRSR